MQWQLSVGSGVVLVVGLMQLLMVGGCSHGDYVPAKPSSPALPPATANSPSAGNVATKPAYPVDPTFASRVRKEDFHSQIMANDRKLTIYLPPAYDTNAAQRYPVMYTFTWPGLFIYGADEVPDLTRIPAGHAAPEPLILMGKVQPLIIVSVELPADRTRNERLINEQDEQNSPGFLAARMLVEELKPYIDAKYRTLPDQANTGLCGISIDAHFTLYTALNHPDTFGKLALISPALRNSSYITVRRLLMRRGKPSPWRIWISAGTLEPDLLNEATVLYDSLAAKGWDLSQVKRCISEGDAHNGKAWEKQIGPIFSYLFPAQASAATKPSAKP